MTDGQKVQDIMSTLLRGVIRNGRVEVVEAIDLPKRTEVLISSNLANAGDGPMSPEEIARVHAAMQKLLPLDIPADVAVDLDAWERTLNQYGIDNAEKGIENVFR